ncbi:MAG TPA: DUF1707 domain-containing protein [Microlunatus sp.]
MSDSVPQRIGDAERDRAAEYLREHMSVGRLSQDEFDERVTAALQARTAADLEPLFDDLPAPKPGQDVAVAGSTPWPAYQPPGTPSPSASALVPMPDSKLANALAAASGVAWILFILSWALGFGVWWFVFIPIALSSAAGKQRQELHRREALWQKQQSPQLPPGSGSDPPPS